MIYTRFGSEVKIKEIKKLGVVTIERVEDSKEFECHFTELRSDKNGEIDQTIKEINLQTELEDKASSIHPSLLADINK